MHHVRGLPFLWTKLGSACRGMVHAAEETQPVEAWYMPLQALVHAAEEIQNGVWLNASIS